MLSGEVHGALGPGDVQVEAGHLVRGVDGRLAEGVRVAGPALGGAPAGEEHLDAAAVHGLEVAQGVDVALRVAQGVPACGVVGPAVRGEHDAAGAALDPVRGVVHEPVGVVGGGASAEAVGGGADGGAAQRHGPVEPPHLLGDAAVLGRGTEQAGLRIGEGDTGLRVGAEPVVRVEAGCDVLQLAAPVVLGELPPAVAELQQHLGGLVVVGLDEGAALLVRHRGDDLHEAQGGERDGDDRQVRGPQTRRGLRIVLGDGLHGHAPTVGTDGAGALGAGVAAGVVVLEADHAVAEPHLVAQAWWRACGRRQLPPGISQ